MAEALGVAASVAGLITLADIVVRKGYKFLKEAKDAEKTVKKIVDEVNALSGVLHSLNNVVERLELPFRVRNNSEDQELGSDRAPSAFVGAMRLYGMSSTSSSSVSLDSSDKMDEGFVDSIASSSGLSNRPDSSVIQNASLKRTWTVIEDDDQEENTVIENRRQRARR